MLSANVFLIIYLCAVILFETIHDRKSRKRKIQKKIGRFLVRIVFYIYIFLLVKVTIFPIPYQKTELDSLKNIFGTGLENNFIPLRSIVNLIKNNTGFTVKLRQLGGNLLLLFPLAFYLPFSERKFQKAGRVFMLLFATSCAVEAAQFLIGRWIGYNYRVVDIDDVILNVCGGMTGYPVWKWLSAKMRDIGPERG